MYVSDLSTEFFKENIIQKILKKFLSVWKEKFYMNITKIQ